MDILGMKESDAKKYIDAVLFNTTRQGYGMKEVEKMGLMKEFNPMLEPFIGVHELQMTELPLWWKEFKSKWAEDIIPNIRPEIEEQLHKEFCDKKATLKEAQLLLDARQQFTEMSVEDLKKGTFPNGRKILKYLVSVSEQVRGKMDYEKHEWFQFFNKCNISQGKTYMVITPSIASHLAQSNAFEKEDQTSCQAFTGYAEEKAIPEGIIGSILNEDSLMVYVTQGAPRKIRGTELEHQSMIARTHLRIFKTKKSKCKVCGSEEGSASGEKICCTDPSNIVEGKDNKFYIVFDRFYTKDSYFKDVFLKVQEIAEKNGMKMGYYSDYNKSRDNSVANYKVELSNSFTAYMPNGVKVMTRGRICEFCSAKDNGSCKVGEKCEYWDDCKSKKCNTCTIKSGCAYKVFYYADQQKSIYSGMMHLDKTRCSSSIKEVLKIQ